MLALFSPPVLLFDKCAFVCTLIQYISRFATCQANFSCKLWETQRKFQPATGYLYPSRWLRLSDDVATATTEMERSEIEVAVLVLMPESFRSCGDSHDWDGASAESKFSGSPAKSFLPTSPASLPLSDFYLNHRSALPFLYTTFFTPAAPLLWGCPFPPCT